MPMMNLRLARPDVLLDLNALAELQFIRETQEHIDIGAMTRYTELEHSALIKRHVPLFTQALPHIAHSAIRNRGTIGGSAALADPAAEMPALLICLGASITLASKQGLRHVPAADFFLGVFETAREENEIIQSFSIPKATASTRFGFYELARRHGDYAMAGVAVAARGVDPYVGLRIVFFSIGDHALRAVGAENALEGARDTDEVAFATALASIRQLDLAGDLNAQPETKAHLAGVVLKRALDSLAVME